MTRTDAKYLVQGSWSTRWGDWVIHLRCTGGLWRAIVWRWTTGGRLEERTQLGLCEGFGSAADATAWACDHLREGGAKVFVIDKPQLRLEDVLRFHPAPEAVSCATTTRARGLAL
jgi:hypothetical protein